MREGKDLGIRRATIGDVLEPVSTPETFLNDTLEEHAILSALHVKGVVHIDTDLSTLYFRGCLFENCRFVNCDFNKCDFSDAVFRKCDFSNSTFNKCYFNRCEFISSKGTGMAVIGSTLLNTVFSDMLMPYANFDTDRFDKVLIENSDFGEGNLSQCQISNFHLEQVNLKRTSFFKTPLKGVDLRSCTIESLVLSEGLSELFGARISAYQAADIVKLMGIIID